MLSNSLPGLDFGLGGDVEMLRDTVRDFAQDKIAPQADEIDRSNSFPRELWPQLGALGLLGITVEEEWGGAGMGDLARVGRRRPVLWRAFEPLRQSDPEERRRRAEAPLFAETDLRRARRRAGDVRAGRGIGRSVDAHARRPQGRPLHPQRLEN